MDVKIGNERPLTKRERICKRVADFVRWSFTVFLVIMSVYGISVFYDYLFPEKKVSIVSACKRDVNNPNAVVPVDGSCRDVVLVSGLIKDDTVNQFKELADPVNLASAGINTVCFYSEGGEPKSGHDLAVEINNRKLNTCIADLYILGAGKDGVKPTVPAITESSKNIGCTSTCPFVFLAGQERILLGDKIQVKVHKPGKVTTFLNLKEVDRKDIEISKEEDFFLKMSKLVSDQHKGGVNTFYKTAMDKKFSDRNLLLIPNDELVRMNVVTRWDSTI